MAIRKRDSKRAKNGYVWQVYFHKYHYYKSGFATKREAEIHEREKLAEYEKYGVMTNDKGMQLEDLYLDFLDHQNAYQENTIYNTKRYIAPFMQYYGKLRIANINKPLIQSFFDSRINEGYATNTEIKKALNRVFKYAIEKGYLLRNPLDYVKVGGVKKHMEHSNYLTNSDFNRLAAALSDIGRYMSQCYLAALYLGYYGGLRASECLALQRDDIDFKNGVIHVRHKLIYQGRKREEYLISDMMKTETSEGDVPIHDDLVKPLKKWLRTNKKNIVFCNKDGLLISPDAMSNYIKKVAKRLDIDFHYHALRHTLATNLYLSGVDVKTASAILRHKNITTTLQIYTEISEEQKKKALNDAEFK